MKRAQGEEVEVELVETSKKVLVSRDDMQKMNLGDVGVGVGCGGGMGGDGVGRSWGNVGVGV